MAPATSVELRLQPRAPEKPKPKGLPCRGGNLARKAEDCCGDFWTQLDARQPPTEWEASKNEDHQQGEAWEEVISEEYLQRYCDGADLTQVEGLEIRVDSVHQNVEALGRCLPQLLRLNLSRSNILCVRDLGVQLHRLQVLWLGRCGLQDLSGIGLMEGLKEFYLPFNDVADVSQLKWLNLQVLDLEGNALADAQDLWELGQCLELRHLTLRGCPVAPSVRSKAWLQLREELRAQLPHLECLDDEDVNLEVSVFRPPFHRRSKMDPAMGARLLDHYVQSDLDLYLDFFLEDDLLDRLHEVPSPMRPRGSFAEPDEEELVVERLKAAPRGEILLAASPIGSPQAASFGPLHLPPRGRESCTDDGSLLTRGKDAMAGNVLGALRARRGGESAALLDLDIRELLRRCAVAPVKKP